MVPPSGLTTHRQPEMRGQEDRRSSELHAQYVHRFGGVRCVRLETRGAVIKLPHSIAVAAGVILVLATACPALAEPVLTPRPTVLGANTEIVMTDMPFYSPLAGAIGP